MSPGFETSGSQDASDKPRRAPAVVLAAACLFGILADRVWPVSLEVWLALVALASGAWLATFAIHWRWVSVGVLLVGWFGIAGAWHHWRWNCRTADDIANSATAEPQLARLTGKVIQTPWIIHHLDGERARWQNPEHTILVVACRSLATNSAVSLPVSGIARLTVDGALKELVLGDLIEVTGELLIPGEPANPGDFDQRSFLRAQGIYTVVRSDFVECVTVIGRERTVYDWLLVLRGALRTRAEQLIANWLEPDTAPVAQAMLLGSRVQIDYETRRAFRESGMLHILAISGMNVGLLWSWLWTLSRWLGRSAHTSTWIVLIALPVYAVVTDASPPIVRATVVAVVVAYGQLLGRTGSIGNSLALAGLSVLAWNPCDLFNTGAQLSFLAVFAILHATSWLTLLRERASSRTDDAPLETSWRRRTIVWLSRKIFEANVIGLAVWLMTSPLVASEFHLVSPIGSLLTIVMTIPVTVMFWIGYSFLLLGLVWSSAFGWLGLLFDGCLRFFLASVHAAARIDIGHVYVPSPPGWWTTGFYLLTLLPMVFGRPRQTGRAISVRLGLAWIVLGLSWDLYRTPHPGVTCTFISVGHGLSVLIECPNGRTALYDAGGMVGGDSIARTISQALWVTGRSRLDAIVISHADGDHCNAVPELSRIVPPGGLFVHRSFLDWKQPAVTAAVEQSASVGASVRLLAEGQSLILDPDVSIRVLHPPHDFRSPLDNPNSLVLCIEYAGRRIVLTGDLELGGLDRLLRTPRIDVDVLLAPHHGSLKANPPDLARWATPEWLIVSTPEPLTVGRLATRYGPETQILTTADCGAIRCRIEPDGELRVEPFKTRPKLPR